MVYSLNAQTIHKSVFATELEISTVYKISLLYRNTTSLKRSIFLHKIVTIQDTIEIFIKETLIIWKSVWILSLLPYEHKNWYYNKKKITVLLTTVIRTISAHNE